MKAYTASRNGTRVAFTELGTGECRLVPKNTGVLVYAESENSVDKLAVPAAAAMPSMDGVTNLFEGTNGTSTTVEGDVNAYILGFKAEEGVKFYKLSATSRTIARNKAYLVMPNSAPVSAFYFDFEDTITGIESVDATSREADAIYDLAGRNVKANQRGLYIVGGKKVIR